MKPHRAEYASVLLAALALTLVTTPAAAQEDPEDVRTEAASFPATADAPDIEQEIVEIEHVDPSEIRRVLQVFPLHVTSHESLGLITLRGARGDLDAAVEVARRLDVPRERSPSVEVVAHVLHGSRIGADRGEVPTALADVADQLRNVFGFRRVDLLDSLLVRASDRAAGQVKGFLAQDAEPVGYRFGFNRLELLSEAGSGAERQVRLDGLVFETDSAGGDVRLVTDLEVREGQQAVVGKAASGREANESLIVVVEVRVVD